MTKTHRQPKPTPAPKRKAVTVATVKKLARECGLTRFEVYIPIGYEQIAMVEAWGNDPSEPCLTVEYPSRSVALRVMHAALLAMTKERR